MPNGLADKLQGIVGSRHVLAGIDCSPYVLEGRTPEAVVFPGSNDDTEYNDGTGGPIAVSGVAGAAFTQDVELGAPLGGPPAGTTIDNIGQSGAGKMTVSFACARAALSRPHLRWRLRPGGDDRRIE